ncbi:hypothetical protein BZA77DRAFT_96571 [Pyronema omphalodes]|nr:hypothetical protein BZA77DRAFT_96571 [Pyronema omphalodes]
MAITTMSSSRDRRSSSLSDPPTSDEESDNNLQTLSSDLFSEIAWLIDFVNRHYGPDEPKDWKMVTYEYNRHFRTTKSQRGVLVTYSNVLRRGKRKRAEGEESATRKPKHSRATRGAKRAQTSPRNEEKASEYDGDNDDEDQLVQSDTAGDDNDIDHGDDDDSEGSDAGDDENNDDGDDDHAE